MSEKKYFKSYLIIIVVILVALLMDMDFKNWRKRERVIEHDVHSYYGYLPAIFIFDDIKLEKSDYRYDENGYWFWLIKTKEGKYVLKMTCGVAILYSPFFFVGDAVAGWFGYPQTGFSEPYKFFLLLSSLFYLFVGLFFVRRLLMYFEFNDTIIAVSLALLGLGTHLLCYASQSGTMSHVYSFSMISMFLFYSVQWYRNKRIKYLVLVGLLLGLISLIRLTNSLVFVFFILYGVREFKDIRKNLSEWWHFVIIIAAAFLVWIPQILYWKAVTGQYFVQTYGEEGKFYFLDPFIYKGLLGFRKGWLIYTPMMFFAIFGLFQLKEKLAEIRIASIVFLILNIYIILSFWCWWYGGSFGMRPMIDCYALLAIPLATFVCYIGKQKVIVKTVFTLISVFFIWLNIFQTYQFERGSLHYEGMNQTLYFKQFGKLDKIEDFDKYISWINAKDQLYRK